LKPGIRKDACWTAFFLLSLLPIHLWAQDSTITPAASTGQIKKSIHQSKKDLAAIQRKLAEEKKKQHEARLKERNVLAHLQRVDQVLGKLRREKEVNEQDLQETRFRINHLQGAIGLNQGQLAQSRWLLKQRLRDLYRMSFRRPLLGGLLDSQSFSDLARKIRFEMLLAKSNEKLLDRTLGQKERLERDKVQWSQEERRRERILDALGHQEGNYSVERKNRQVLLASIHNDLKVRTQTIEDLNSAAEDLKEKVASLLARAVEAKRQTVAWASEGEGLKVKRGKIPWPVSGEILPEYSFGRHKNREFNAVVDNSGIQIEAPLGTPFRAVAPGLVRFADWFKGYGKLVILDHGQGYYSLYAQASELNVSEGQKVAAGQVLGAVGDTGSLVGSSLYFEIRKNGVPQDPLRWLSRR